MSESTATADELVGVAEVAEMLGLDRGAVRSYRSRGYLPEPFVVLAMGPIWRREEIIDWYESRPGKGWRKAAA